MPKWPRLGYFVKVIVQLSTKPLGKYKFGFSELFSKFLFIINANQKCCSGNWWSKYFLTQVFFRNCGPGLVLGRYPLNCKIVSFDRHKFNSHCISSSQLEIFLINIFKTTCLFKAHRNRVFHDFRDGNCRNLVCSDLFTRGESPLVWTDYRYDTGTLGLF